MNKVYVVHAYEYGVYTVCSTKDRAEMVSHCIPDTYVEEFEIDHLVDLLGVPRKIFHVFVDYKTGDIKNVRTVPWMLDNINDVERGMHVSGGGLHYYCYTDTEQDAVYKACEAFDEYKKKE